MKDKPIQQSFLDPQPDHPCRAVLPQETQNAPVRPIGPVEPSVAHSESLRDVRSYGSLESFVAGER